MVFVWLFLLADVHLKVHAQKGNFSLYGLKFDPDSNLLNPNDTQDRYYEAVYAGYEKEVAQALFQGYLPLISSEGDESHVYDIIIFGKNLGDRDFVLTKDGQEKNTLCTDLKHTSKVTVGNTTKDDELEKIKTTIDFRSDPPEGIHYFCFKNGTEYVHAGKEPYQSIQFIKVKQSTILPLPWQVLCITLLLMLSGTFSGLNLGLMALDPQQLKILQTAGNPNEQKYARAVLPVREYGNFLLCTLLLGNVLVNNTLTILLDDLTSGTVAIVGATAGIVVFGEIIPQAICSRHGLYIGFRTLPLTYFFMAITGILSYPLGKLLDIVLGDEIGVVYNRHRFLEIIKQAHNDLEDDEKQMIEGALKLNEKSVKDVMTQINYVFTVSEDAIIDYDFMQKITEAGYSRIPVTKKTDNNGAGDITGLLFLRDLVMVDPDDRIEVSTVTNYYKHQLKSIDECTKLDDMLEIFKNGAYHLSLVTHEVEVGGGKKEVETVGIITLEDIIEEIICDEIVDETDKYINNRSRERNTKREKMDPDFIDSICRNANNGSNPSNPHNPDNLDEISRNQVAAMHRFLVAEVAPFAPNLIVESQLRNLLNRQDSLIYVKRNNDTKALYEKGKTMTYFIIIIEGKAEVSFGHEAEMPIEVGPFRCFGIAALMDVRPSHLGSLLKANKGSQSIPNGVLGADSSMTRLTDALDRGSSCPPSAATTPATTPIGAPQSHISDYTVTITSDEFVYAKITRVDYRNMRNQMEIKKAQKVSSMEQINRVSDATLTKGFEGAKSPESKSEVTVSSEAICQSDFTEEKESSKLIPKDGKTKK